MAIISNNIRDMFMQSIHVHQFSSPLLLAVFVFRCLFFCEDINRRAGAGTDRTDAGGDRNAGQDEGVNG